MRSVSNFEKLLSEKERALFEQLLKSSAQGNAVQSAFFAGQIQTLREAPAMYRKAHSPAADPDGDEA